MFRYLLLVLVLVAGPLDAQTIERTVPDSRSQLTLSFAPIVKEVAPAVVNIYAERMVSERVSPFANDPFFALMFGQQFDNMGVPRRRLESALGSGVIVRADGLIVTNRHVIQQARDIKVILNDRREFSATVVTVDEKTDLAVLRADVGAARLPLLQLGDSDAIDVGDLVLAIGNPFGVGQSVTSGIVSATARTADGINDYGYFIQTDAAINPGNSGGALVDMNGRLIGINTAIYSQSGGSLGIGFAIPANLVKTVIEAGESGQRIVRPWLGAGVQPVTAAIATSLGLDRPVGVLVKSLHEASPLKAAGLRVGDIVTAINGQPIESADALAFRLATQSVGGKATVAYLHDGQPESAQFNLIAAPEDPPRDETLLKGRQPFAGATVVNLSPAVIDETGYDGDRQQGVLVTKVARQSAAAYVRLQAGDVILQINRKTINSVEDLQQALDTPQPQWRVSILRGRQVINTVLGG